MKHERAARGPHGGRQVRRAVFLVLVALFFAAALDGAGRGAGAGARRQESAPLQGRWFFVAVLRRDGVVVPFATYWQGFWLTPWPAPEGYPPETNSLADLPEAWFESYGGGQSPEWYANGPAIGRSLKLRAARTVEVENHCGKNWGLRTDYASRGRASEVPHGNVGIAASAPVEIVAPVRVGASVRGRGPVVSIIGKQFEANERDWLARPDVAPRAKLFPAAVARGRRAPTITALYSVQAGGGRRLYYFEAERRYPKPSGAQDAACESVSAMSGMLMQAAGAGAAPRLVERQFALSDCDGKELSSGRPLGLVRDGRREFLIMEEHGYEDESYTIIELLGATLRRLRSVEGGGC